MEEAGAPTKNHPMLVGFTYAISAYHHRCELESRSYRGVLDTKLCDKGRCLSPGTPVSSTNKTDLHDISKILLKVALNNITVTPTQYQQNKHPPLTSTQ